MLTWLIVTTSSVSLKKAVIVEINSIYFNRILLTQDFADITIYNTVCDSSSFQTQSITSDALYI